MSNLFPPSGPWVYESSLPKPSAGENSLKDLINFQRTEASINGVNVTALEKLYQELIKYNILNSLDDINERFTVLAPNTNAFSKYNTEYNNFNDDQRSDFLKSHVVLGRWSESDLLSFAANNTEVATLGTAKLRFFLDSQNDLYVMALNNISRIINKNHLATNGVIHHLNSVLVSLDPAQVPDTKGVIFAQLKINTANIEESQTHTVELFDDKLKDTVQVSQYYGITGDNMKRLFYSHNDEFGMPIIETAMNILTGNKHLIKGWRHASGEDKPIQNHGYNLMKEVINFWEQDVGITYDKWSKSSYIDITRELMIADRWTELSNCNINSALSYTQLIESLNQHLAKYSFPQKGFKVGNKLILSILISNGNAETKPVEILLHFIVSEDETN